MFRSISSLLALTFALIGVACTNPAQFSGTSGARNVNSTPYPDETCKEEYDCTPPCDPEIEECDTTPDETDPEPTPYPDEDSQPNPNPDEDSQPNPYPDEEPLPNPNPDEDPQPNPYPDDETQPNPNPDEQPAPGPEYDPEPAPNPAPNEEPYPEPKTCTDGDLCLPNPPCEPPPPCTDYPEEGKDLPACSEVEPSDYECKPCVDASESCTEEPPVTYDPCEVVDDYEIDECYPKEPDTPYNNPEQNRSTDPSQSY